MVRPFLMCEGNIKFWRWGIDPKNDTFYLGLTSAKNSLDIVSMLQRLTFGFLPQVW